MQCNLREVFGIPIAPVVPRPSSASIPSDWDGRADVPDRQRWQRSIDAQSPWSERMRRPNSCTAEGEHPARFRVWLKNGAPESVASTFNCFVPRIDWDRRWRKFEDAAREMGIVR